MGNNTSHKIDLKVNTKFDFNGTTMIVVEDDIHNSFCGCDDCDFNDTEYCSMFQCLSGNREDETDVHFEKIKEDKI